MKNMADHGQSFRIRRDLLALIHKIADKEKRTVKSQLEIVLSAGLGVINGKR